MKIVNKSSASVKIGEVIGGIYMSRIRKTDEQKRKLVLNSDIDRQMRLYDISRQQMCRFLNLKQTAYYRRRNDCEYTLTEFVSLINNLHMSNEQVLECLGRQ